MTVWRSGSIIVENDERRVLPRPLHPPRNLFPGPTDMPTEPEHLFDAEHAAFMQSGVSVSVASCSTGNLPHVVRALGCRVAPDRRIVRILVSRTQSVEVLADIGKNAAIAVVYSEPPTLRTVQLKGRDAIVETATEDDVQAVIAYRHAFVKTLDPLGYDEVMVRTALACSRPDIVALRFTPCAAFSQTPGPHAGEALKMPA